MHENILVSSADGVTRIAINRAEKKNALTQAMYAAMADALESAATDENARVVLIHGSETVFTAGNDIADFLGEFSLSEGAEVLRFLHALAGFPKPVVAAVNGPAIGIGTTMLLHCDLVYAGEGSRFHLPFVNLGLVPEAASSLLLPLQVGYHRAAEMILLGQPFGAEMALRAGIVNKIVSDDQTLIVAQQVAAQLASLPASAVQSSKALLKRALTQPIIETMAHENRLFLQHLASPEAAAAFQSFLAPNRPS